MTIANRWQLQGSADHPYTGQEAKLLLRNRLDHGSRETCGFLLSNGQDDTYADRDTVPFDVAVRAVAHLIDHGVWPDDVKIER